MCSAVRRRVGHVHRSDHSYPSRLELELAATDSDGAAATASIELEPQTVALTFATSPAGLLLVAAADQAAAARFTRTDDPGQHGDRHGTLAAARERDDLLVLGLV